MVAGVNIPLRDDDPDYPALVLGNYMLGGGFLNSRLAVRIRGKKASATALAPNYRRTRSTKRVCS